MAVRTNESITAGPAPSITTAPLASNRPTIISLMLEKSPAPMIAPIPSSVRSSAPSDFLSPVPCPSASAGSVPNLRRNRFLGFMGAGSYSQQSQHAHEAAFLRHVHDAPAARAAEHAEALLARVEAEHVEVLGEADVALLVDDGEVLLRDGAVGLRDPRPGVLRAALDGELPGALAALAADQD